MRKILSFLTAILFAGSMMATNYELVTSASQLQAGAKYVIGTATGKFIATTSYGNNRKITDGTITENVVEGTDDMMVFTLGGEADAWTFATDNYLGTAGYLNATSSTGSNYLKVVADLDDYAYFTIDIADGVTTVTCNGKASRNILYLNGTTCFACYNSQTQAQYIKPNLYKEVSDAPATGKTFYLALSADWAGWPAKYSMYYFKSENDANGFSAFMTEVPDTTNIYTGTIPDGYDKMIFVRHDGEASEPTWENKWSQTVNLDVPTNGDNLFTVVSGGTGSECNGTWSVYGEEPAPYVPTLENGFYLIGQNGWDVAALSADLLFAANQDTEGEYKLTTTLAEGQSIKVVKVENDAIVAWYPDGMGNEYTVDAAHAGEKKDIYFQETYKEDWAAFGGHIWTGSNAEPQPAAVVLPATLDVTNVSFRSEGMPNFVIEEGQDYAGTYFDMGAHDSSNDTALYAEWNVTIQPMKYNIAVDVYNNNSWSVRLYLLNQTGDTVKALYYKGHSGEKGQFAIGSLELSDLEAGDYKVRARAATGWSEMKLKDVIFTADYQGVNVDLPGTLLPAYAELSAGASIANNAIAFVPSTANNEYAIWNVTFAEAGDYNVTIDMTASNGHTYGVALLSADGESQIGAVAEAQAWDTGVKELGAITVPAAGSYKVKLTNATQWSEAVLNSITFAAPQPQGCDWDNIDFLGDGSPEQTFGNQFKICMPEGMSVVNIQKPGFASESGIYVNFPSAVFGEISLAEGQYVIEGAGMLLYLSAFTQEYTEVTVNWNGNDIVFTVYNAKGGTPEPVANYYVIGSMTGWEVSEDYILTPNNEAEGQEFMGEFTFAANDAFKVVKNNKEVWYPDGIGNDFVISEAGDYTVYFRPNGDGGEGWHYGYIYAAKKEATAISNTAADAEAVKVLNNGMLLIRKGDKTYNVMGQAVK